jgi:hypothetical protein
MLPDTQHNREQAFEHMFGMPKEWLDELITDWQEPLMGGLTMLAMSVLSDAQERIALGHDDIARQYINRAKYVIKQMEQVK